MKKIFFLLLILSFLAVPQAAVIRYNSRATFEAALASYVLIDFSPTPARGPSTQIFQDLTLYGGGGLHGSTSFGAPSSMISAENGGPITMTLASGYKALGAEFGDLFNQNTASFTIRDSSNTILETVNLTVAKTSNFNSASTTFYGWISDGNDLLSILFSHSGFEALDNVIYGNQTAPSVPEASTTLIFALGLFILARYRK